MFIPIVIILALLILAAIYLALFNLVALSPLQKSTISSHRPSCVLQIIY